MMKWMFAALATAALCGCAKSSEPAAGSQTHFLASCDGSCAAPYECLCGVCTRACTEGATCRGEADGAACVDPASSCDVSSMICDVQCSEDAECSGLGALHVCNEGRCREREGNAGDGGAGGSGGSGGSGGMGGSGGTAGVSGMGAGSGGMGGTGGTTPELGALCDGSTDMRLGYAAAGGFVDITFYFTNPYGHWFLFVDGQCNYYLSREYPQGIVSGTLDDEQASTLADAIGWPSIAELAVEDVESCPDAGANVIWAPGGIEVSCTCGCDEGPVSQRKTDALQYMYELLETLAQSAAPLMGPVSALAAPESPVGDELTWPLDQPLATIPNLVHDLDSLGDEFALFEDPDDAAALRALRATAQPGTPVRVADGEGAYQIYVRDELPEGVAPAIEALRGSAMP